MATMPESALLSLIMKKARELMEENQCSALTRDYILAAALNVVKSVQDGVNEEEFKETCELLKQLSGNTASAEAEPEKGLIAAWKGKTVSSIEQMLLSAQKAKAYSEAQKLQHKALQANTLLAIILANQTSAMQQVFKKPVISSSAASRPHAEPAREEDKKESKPGEEAKGSAGEEMDIGKLALKTKEMQKKLDETVLGQSHAVSVFASGYFQAELQAAINKQRSKPRATFLFAGPPGVGKTFLSEQAAEYLSLPFRRFDMSEYTGPNATDELSGSDANYKASSEGLLTGFVNEHPRCVLLFDEIEKASLDVLHLFLQVLDAGRLRDNRTDKEVSFKDAILIFTTNAGKNLYQDSETANLSGISRDVILDALERDVNPKTREPYFPAALCSRFASGNVIMFNHLEACTLRQIGEKQLIRHFGDLQRELGIDVSMDDYVPTAILLAEGAAADARTVKSRADSFFGKELFELFRLVTSDRVAGDAYGVKQVHFSVDMDNADAEISALFVPAERVHALVYTKEKLGFDNGASDLPVFHYVSTVEEARSVIKNEDIKMLICNLQEGETAEKDIYLNREDVSSEGRDFLYSMMKRYPDMPVLLVESEDCRYSEEEKDSFLWRGVRAVIRSDGENAAQKLREVADIIFQQQSLTELARANKLVSYETAQCVMNGGHDAEIILFDMKLQTAVKADDGDNVMSMFSKPDVRFDDVIGADDAKEELRFFANCMKEPKKYLRKGAAAPKGVLLYGPPGTGKTMLAKAFAAESGATFIATEGNRFFKGYVGQGAEMAHRLFAIARRYAPAVLFIDEVDAVAKARTGRDTDMGNDTEQILTAIFAEMDGFSTDSGKSVFVLGATNYGVNNDDQLKLDPAFLRRFDRRILIDLPDGKDRKLFLQKEIGKRELFNVSEQMIDSIADRSAGMSLAQLKSFLELAVRNALRLETEYIDDKALEEAYETFNSGEKREWNREIMLRTARHEAGHVLISWLNGEKPAYVTIVSRSNYGGYMQHENQEDRMGYTKAELLGRIRTALGGRAAEMVCYGDMDGISTGASGDLHSATSIAQKMLCYYGMNDEFGLSVMNPASPEAAAVVRESVNALLKEQLRQAIDLINQNRDIFDHLVSELLLHNNLRAKDIDKILSA